VVLSGGTITHSTLSGNDTAGGPGGGAVSGGTVTITHNTLSGNGATGSGGGVAHSGGPLTVTNSTLSGNDAIGSGGGVVSYGGPLTLTHSTLSGNTATYGDGGGVANGSRNFAGGTVTLTRTLLSGNTAPTGAELDNSSRGGTVVANNHNLFGVNGTAGVEGFTPGATDLVPPMGVQLADILDPPRADNGGPTLTHALVPGSPARNAGPRRCRDARGRPLRRDQRGVLRPQEGRCDIGAVEFLPVVFCAGRRATLVGSAAADVLRGTAGDDVIVGLDGNDVLVGRGGNDILCGRAGDDLLEGGAGADLLRGGAGTDECHGGRGTDTAAGCETQDRRPPEVPRGRKPSGG
jgi:Ca2+-binding RTX toxin-like protein